MRFALILLGALAVGCSDGGGIPLANLEPPGDDQWSTIVSPYLSEDLWSSRDAYDAGHVLLVPLLYSAQLEAGSKFAEFGAQFERFVDAAGAGFTSSRLSRLQYFYLASVFLEKAAERGVFTASDQALLEMIEAQVSAYWSTEPAWQWDRPDFAGGMRERLLWKLETPDTSYNFYQAVLDEDLFLMAISAQAHMVHEILGTDVEHPSDEIFESALRVLRERGHFTQSGGWLFQVGLWSDHRDFAFAGRDSVLADLTPAPVLEISEDVSHSVRFPAWLLSLLKSPLCDPSGFSTLSSIRESLARQMLSHALVPPTEEVGLWRTNNFLDGSNGVYRYNYPTQGIGGGYGPYELSGTFYLGWWALLDTPEIRAIYRAFSERTTFEDEELAALVGPNTSRARHPSVAYPEFFTQGFAGFLSRLAAQLQDTRVNARAGG